MPKDAKPADDTEKGFGTGLRAQLQRRRDSAQEELDASNEAFAGSQAADGCRVLVATPAVS